MTTSRVLDLAYPRSSEVVAPPHASTLALGLDGNRAKVAVRGRVNDPELFRDALLVAMELRQSDLRYRGKDRTAYLAYLMKKGQKATAAIWEAQKTFLESAYADAAPRPRGLDPVLTVDPDEISLEVFSRDESAYARLAFANELFEDRAVVHGTTLVESTPELLGQIARIRTYQPLSLDADQPAVPTVTGSARSVDVPDEWLRGFLQVQSAAMLPGAHVELAPIDLYNLLFVLRTHKAKKAPRGVRFELVPGQRPILVVEPWEITLECHGAVFEGSAPRVVRLFGRQRLLTLARALPHLVSVRVQLPGAGLPSFWTLDMGAARLTVALTSWSESPWASAASFDALLPAEADAVRTQSDALVRRLQSEGPLTLAQLAAGGSPADTRAALSRAALQGRVLYDLDRGLVRPRLLLAEPIDPAQLRYGSTREEAAHRLLEEREAVQITKVHTAVGEGQEVHGEVVDKLVRRTFAPRFSVDLENNVREAWCNCPTYQRSGLREGPCEHMIALYVFDKRERVKAEQLRATPEGRKLVRAETRTLVRRDGLGAQEEVRLSLDDRVVRIERRQRGAQISGADERHSRMWFDTDLQAREAYFARLDELANKGFIDTEALSA